MGSGSANELPTPSSTSGPRFNNEADALAFDRPTMRVGRYRILSELGRGGMSNVYLAVARGPGGVNKLVVLKALLPDLSTEPYALAMFLDEARLAAQLNHPNVVQTYEVGTESDRHVIVMEYLEGQSLSATVRRAEQLGAPLSLALHLRVIISVLEGLHYAHELKAYDGAPLLLVHRDISPQNVFVTYDGQVKVLDFGIAKATSSSTHTATGVVKGKIAYMAPEQIIGDQVDLRADIYSVGCMLWSAACNRKLWKDIPDVHIMRRVINGDVPTPQSVNPGCDDELNRIVMKALANDPAHRYQTALELQQDLEQYVDRHGPTVKQKDIARYVSESFAETRAQLKAVVERQLTLIQADETSGSGASQPLPMSGTQVALSSSSRSFIPTQIAGGAEARPRRGRTFAVVLFLALVGGAGFLYAQQKAAEQRVAANVTPPTPAAAPAPAAPTTAPTVTRVSIALKAQPAEAKLFLDNVPLPSNPTTKLMAVDGSTHVLRAVAPGFSEATREFSATSDGTFELSLSAVGNDRDHDNKSKSGGAVFIRRGGARVPSGPAAAPSAPVTSAPPPATAAAKPDCDSPFFLDKDGIRRVRPECR